MQTFDPMAAVYDGDKRHTHVSTPWELYHEASKLSARDLAVAEQARDDRILRAEILRQEQRVNEASAKAPTCSSFFHSRPRVFLPLARRSSVDGGATLAEVVRARRSVTEFGTGSISTETLSFLLGYAAGVTHAHPVTGAPLRAAPSSGGLYELELYVALRRVEGLASGLYHYHANSHSLARLAGEEVLAPLGRAAVSRALVETAAAYFLMTSVIGRLEWKYAQRAYRFALLNAGHTAQQLCLAATDRALAACPHGGFMDDEVARCLGIDAVTEFVTHTVGVGHPPPHSRKPAAPETAKVSRRLRRLDSLDLAPRYRDWRVLEELAVAAVGAAADDPVAARESLVHLGALLPGDRSVADYCRCLEDPQTSLEVDDHGVFAFPVEWDPARRLCWRDGVAAASLLVRDWLGVASLPRTFLDFRTASAIPKTDNLDRWLHRRVTFPTEQLAVGRIDEGLLLHELAHAAYLPHNAMIAEGIASAIGLGAGEPTEIARELRAESPMPELFAWVFRGETPQLTPHLAPAVAASVVATLCQRFGRASLLRWTDTFLYPATTEERRAAMQRFEESFGETFRAALEAWWSQCR